MKSKYFKSLEEIIHEHRRKMAAHFKNANPKDLAKAPGRSITLMTIRTGSSFVLYRSCQNARDSRMAQTLILLIRRNGVPNGNISDGL